MVMTERSSVAAKKLLKQDQHQTQSRHSKNKSFSKGGGSALAKSSKTQHQQ